MPFYPDPSITSLPEVPDSISIASFMLDEQHGRAPISKSQNPFTCGLTGRSYSTSEVQLRVEYLARALRQELGFDPYSGTEWDKVVAVFSVNAVDYLTLAWAVHSLGGVLTCANAAYNADELAYQLKDSGAKAIFTCLPLLKTSNDAVSKTKLDPKKTFLLPVPEQVSGGVSASGLSSIDQLIQLGAKLPAFAPSDSKWARGEGARRCAFLCYSSGTSGLPKGVMISHYNVIANVLQFKTAEKAHLDAMHRKSPGGFFTERFLGLLPLSHIYGLVLVGHAGVHRGNGVVVLPKYDFKQLLTAIQNHKITSLFLVPPMIIHLTNEYKTVRNYDLSSVYRAISGAAPLGKETSDKLLSHFPTWRLQQAYGLTETAPGVCTQLIDDIWPGSSGMLFAGMVARLIDPSSGAEITTHNTPGELWVTGPNITLGYHHNAAATAETFVTRSDDGKRYMRTGDEAVLARHPTSGHEHIFITDRIKELIKVKGHQVAPAELEAHLLAHEAVSDCVVIGVPADREGEVPKAFVVKSPDAGAIEESDALLRRRLLRHVEQAKSNYKWLRGGLEFIDAVPKSPSGKILRRLVRDQERERIKREGAKL